MLSNARRIKREKLNVVRTKRITDGRNSPVESVLSKGDQSDTLDSHFEIIPSSLGGIALTQNCGDSRQFVDGNPSFSSRKTIASSKINCRTVFFGRTMLNMAGSCLTKPSRRTTGLPCSTIATLASTEPWSNSKTADNRELRGFLRTLAHAVADARSRPTE
jgi:hypothetical protein